MSDKPPPGDPLDPTQAAEGAEGFPRARGFPFAQRRLGDFEIVREIGRGGMGIVYEARQVSLGRAVALKVLPPGLGLTPAAIARFDREARAAAQLHHTNIVPVYATGQEGGCHFFAMELVEGQSLADILDGLRGEGSHPLLEATATKMAAGAPSAPARERDRPAGSTSSLSDTTSGGRERFDVVARLIAEVAEALHYAHGRGVVHRDIKPANLLMSRDGRLCVGDFGLARVAHEPGMTVSGSFLGTPAYMSPEQIAAGRIQVDHRTDIYSLGAVLYEVLTLLRPFPGDNREEILSGILMRDPKPPRRINPRIPVDLETICLKALEKDPQRRYATAGQMAEDLRLYLQHGLITARRAGPARRVGKFVRRHPLGTMAALAVLLVAATGALAWRAFSGQAAESAMRALSDARLEMSQGEYRGALADVEKALAINSSLPDARLIRARLLIKMDRAAEAASEAETLLKQNPDEWTTHLILAAAAKSMEGGTRFGASVEEHIKAVEAKAPDTADAHYLRSLVADSDTQALEHLDRALSLDPGHADALFERSDRLSGLHRFDAALADCDRLIAVRPKSARARIQKALVYQHQMDFERALAEIGRALALDPNDVACIIGRGRIRQTLGRQKDALVDFGRAIALDPNDARSYEDRGYSLWDTGRLKEAMADFERAIGASAAGGGVRALSSRWAGPALTGPYVALIRIHRQLGEMDQARGVLNRLEKEAATWSDPKARAGAHREMADAYREDGDYDQALSEADQAIALDRDWRYLIVRAQVRRLRRDESGFKADCASAAAREIREPHDFLRRGWAMGQACDRSDLALTDLTRALQFDPSWAVAYSARAAEYRHLNRFEESLADLTRAIEKAPGAPWWRAERGDIYSDMDRFEEALADYDREIQLAPEVPWAHTSRGWALMALGRNTEALADFNRAVEISPTTLESRASAHLALGRLEEAIADMDKSIEALPISNHYAERAYFETFKPGLCEKAGSDLRKSDEILPEQARDANTLGTQALVHVCGLYYACPDLYDPREALVLAQRAFFLEPRSADFRKMLGFALYRNDLFQEAREALLEVLPSGGVRPDELFFLAMANHKLGDRKEARRDYDRAVAWMEKHGPADVGNLRFKDEAAKLLGLDNPRSASRH